MFVCVCAAVGGAAKQVIEEAERAHLQVCACVCVRVCVCMCVCACVLCTQHTEARAHIHARVVDV